MRDEITMTGKDGFDESKPLLHPHPALSPQGRGRNCMFRK